jgi:indole-3-glycerol phosphate synthase
VSLEAERDGGILARIVAHERGRVARAREERQVAALRRSPGYGLARRSLRAALTSRSPAVIAECKRRSPSRGVLREPYEPTAIASGYASAGAAAISVLTNQEFFGGTLADLTAVRGAVRVPVLRKDFVFDAYQLEEARAAGADAVLLIAAILSADELRSLSVEARELELEVLVEVHDEAEMDLACAVEATLVGINNRNLRTFVTDLAVSERLAPRRPHGAVVVAESGIKRGGDVARLARAGIDCFLIGELFMTAEDPGRALAGLLEEAGGAAQYQGSPSE